MPDFNFNLAQGLSHLFGDKQDEPYSTDPNIFLADAIDKDTLTPEEETKLESYLPTATIAKKNVADLNKEARGISPSGKIQKLFPIERAARKANFTILAKLLKCPFDKDKNKNALNTALIALCGTLKPVSIDLFNDLIKAGADPTFEEKFNGHWPTPLSAAIFAKNTVLIEALLAKNALLAKKDKYALKAAIHSNNNDIINKLIDEVGAVLTPSLFIFACEVGNLNTVNRVIEKGSFSGEIFNNIVAQGLAAAAKQEKSGIIEFIFSKGFNKDNNPPQEQEAIDKVLAKELITTCKEEDLTKVKSLLKAKTFAQSGLNLGLDEAINRKNLPIALELISKNAKASEPAKFAELQLINLQKIQLLDLMTNIIGNNDIKDDKYKLLTKLHEKIKARKFTSVEDTKIAAKYCFTLALQRRLGGFSNTTTSGKNIRTLFAGDAFNELKTALFGNEQVRYRDLRFFVTEKDKESKKNPKFLTSSRKEKTYSFFSTTFTNKANLEKDDLDNFITSAIK